LFILFIYKYNRIFSFKTFKIFSWGHIIAKVFIYSISNILKENILNKTSIKRHNYKTNTLKSIADRCNESFEIFKWYSHKEFYDLEKIIFEKSNEKLEYKEIDKQLENIKDLDENINNNELSLNSDDKNELSDRESIVIIENEMSNDSEKRNLLNK